MPVRKVKRTSAKKMVKHGRCTAKTKEGRRCKRMAIPPSWFCYVHNREK